MYFVKSNSLKPTKVLRKGLTFRERMMFVFGACQDYTFLSGLTFLSQFQSPKEPSFQFLFQIRSLLQYFSLILFNSFSKVIGKNQLNHKLTGPETDTKLPHSLTSIRRDNNVSFL